MRSRLSSIRLILAIACITSGCAGSDILDRASDTNGSDYQSITGTGSIVNGDCNIVVNVVNSSNMNINNPSPCANNSNRFLADIKYCMEQTRVNYLNLYPKGLLTLPLFPAFSVSNYISKQSAQNEATEKDKACLEARGHIIDGYGTYDFENGNIYQGNWKDGAFSGEGIFRWKNGGSYDGDWKEGQKSGKGFDVYADGVTYKGEFQNDMRNGFGVMTWPDGRRFEGHFLNDRPNGSGVFTAVNGELFDGNWSSGCFKDGNRWAVVNQNQAFCH